MSQGIRGNIQSINRRFRSITRNLPTRSLVILAGVLTFGAIGTVLLTGSHAATPTASLEAEDGTRTSCANPVNDSTASGSSAVQFGACLTGLDSSGATIPDTGYTVPAGAIFMATNGNDASAGTQAAPVATLARAMALVPVNGTIVVREGTYRQGVTVQPSRKFTLQPYPHEQVWFDGMVQAPGSGWTTEASGRWSIEWKTPEYCGGKYYNLPFRGQTSPTCSWGQNPSDANDNDYGDAQNPMATNPQMVYINGQYSKEVATLAEVTANTFYYAHDTTNKTGRVYVGQNPSTTNVEITKYTTVMRIQNPNAAGSTIRGIGFKRYATDIYSANITHGVLVLGVPNMTLENNVFARMAGTGVTIIDPTNFTVRSNVFAHNGFDGLEANGHSSSSTPNAIDNLIVEDNVFNANNEERFGCGYACGRGNMKFNHMNQATVQNNLFENAVAGAPGFWCDENCNRMTIVNNVMRGNEGNGLFFEVSNTSIIASNVIVNNGGGLRMTAANTKVYNNTLFNNGSGTHIYDDNRVQDAEGKYGPDTANNEFVNNIMSSTGGKDACARIAILDACNAGGQTNAPQYFSAGNLDYNVYVRTAGVPSALALWQTSSTTVATYTNLANFKTAVGKEANGNEISSTTTPLFINSSTGNYLIANGSPAKASGRGLPSDVAAAIGVTAGQTVDRGALRYWPNGN